MGFRKYSKNKGTANAMSGNNLIEDALSFGKRFGIDESVPADGYVKASWTKKHFAIHELSIKK